MLQAFLLLYNGIPTGQPEGTGTPSGDDG